MPSAASSISHTKHMCFLDCHLEAFDYLHRMHGEYPTLNRALLVIPLESKPEVLSIYALGSRGRRFNTTYWLRA